MFREDKLKHVSFAGRPANIFCMPTRRVRPGTPLSAHTSIHQPEQSCQFISWVLKRAGLDPDRYRMGPLQRRLPSILRSLHTDTEEHAIQLLESRPELLTDAVGALLIGVTEFFRDPLVFETLRSEVLPQLASHDRPLRVWSAGCSNGAELYSVAILLAQAGMLEGSYLLGTDCRFDAIEHARKAFYNLNQLQEIHLPDQCLYFTRAGRNYRPIELLRRNIHWRVADLAQGTEEGPWDLILWRNMAIYLTAEAAEPIWYGLVSALAPDGALLVGRAERPPSALPLVNQKRCVYRIRSDFQPERKVQEISI
jgi:chemotaxis protein methyltransferase CheR